MLPAQEWNPGPLPWEHQGRFSTSFYNKCLPVCSSLLFLQMDFTCSFFFQFRGKAADGILIWIALNSYVNEDYCIYDAVFPPENTMYSFHQFKSVLHLVGILCLPQVAFLLIT